LNRASVLVGEDREVEAAADRRLRILILRAFPAPISPRYYNVQEIGLARELHSRGIDVEIAAAVPKEFQAAGKEYGVQPMLYRGMATLSWFADFSHLDWDSYDVVQISDLCLPGNFQALRRVPPHIPILVYQGHYREPSGYKRWLRLAWTRLTALKLRSRRYSVLAKNDGAAELLASCGLRSPRVVGVGLEAVGLLQQDALPAEVEQFLKKSPPPMLYVGTLDDRRPVKWILPHFRHAALQSSAAIVVGKGPDEPHLRRAYEDLVEHGRLLFVPSLTQGQLGNLYSRAACLVLPTHFEIYGMTCMEGVLFNLPVLASDVPGPRTIARRFPGSVTLIPKGPSPDAWRDALTDALSTRHDKRPNGLPDARSVEKLSWRSQGEVFAAAIRELAGGVV